MSPVASVTVLVPAKNEEADIAGCLSAVLVQDHPHARMEIVVVDGGSDDRTVEVATQILEAGDIDWKIVTNSAGATPSNLNAGLAVATGEILCRVDARSVVPPEYVRLCVEVLERRPDVSVTGGAQVAIASTDSGVSAGIARTLNNKYTMGGSRYRSGGTTGPTDTVYLGAFRTAQLRALGGWDEYFETNQDYELNRRMAGDGLVWFDDRMEVGYIPRQSLAALWRQYHRFGRWKMRFWRRTGDRPQPRQVVPLLGLPFAVGLFICLGFRSRRRWRDIPILSFIGYGALLALDAVGSRPHPSPTVGARLVGASGIALVGVGWTTGVFREAVAPSSVRGNCLR